MKSHFDPQMSVLSNAEVDRLVAYTVKHGGPAGVTKDELRQVVEWAVEARINAVLLERMLTGEISALFRDGEILFGIPSSVKS